MPHMAVEENFLFLAFSFVALEKMLGNQEIKNSGTLKLTAIYFIIIREFIDSVLEKQL